MTTKKRMTKHQLKEDQFVTGVFRFQEWAEENLNTIFIVAGVVIVIIVGIWFFSSQSARSKQAAMDLLGRADVQARNGQTQLAIIDYQKVLDDYSGSNAAHIAAFRLANVYFNSNDWANAESAFRTYLDKYATDDVDRFSAKRGIAMTTASQGKFGDAAKQYWELAQTDSVTGFDNEYLSKAVTYGLKAEDSALAVEAFHKLEQKSPNSEEFRMAKILLIEQGYLTYQEGDYQ